MPGVKLTSDKLGTRKAVLTISHDVECCSTKPPISAIASDESCHQNPPELCNLLTDFLMSRSSLTAPIRPGGVPTTSHLHRRHLLAGLTGIGTAFAFRDRAVAQPVLKGSLAYGSVGYTWALPYVAEAAGYWKDQNVELAASSFESGRDAMQALFSGSADFSASTDTPLVFAALSGLRPVVVGNYSRYSRDMKIAVRSDGAVDAKVPSSLKGRRIATRIGTSGQYLVAKSSSQASAPTTSRSSISRPPTWRQP
jgi:hypothetical protein